MNNVWHKIDTTTGTIILEEARMILQDETNIFYKTKEAVERMAAVALGAIVLYMPYLDKCATGYTLALGLMLLSLCFTIIFYNSWTTPSIGTRPYQFDNPEYFDGTTEQNYNKVLFPVLHQYEQSIIQFREINRCRRILSLWQRIFLILSVAAFAITHACVVIF